MKQPFRLDGKRALVTGGASGIGAAIVATLQRQGAEVTALDLQTEIAGAPAIACDVSSPGSVAAAFAQVDSGGPVDLLVCCAGISHIGDLLTTEPEDFDRVMGVNARGVYLCCREGVRRMKASGRGGAIVNIASLVSKIALSERFAYGASKGAVLMITRSIACDYIHDKIRCNCICPGRVHTPFVDGYLAKNYPGREAEMFAKLSAAQPMGRMGTTQEIADLALYLCSDEAGFVTGVAYDIDGGCMAMR